MVLTDIEHNVSLFEKNKNDFQWDKDVHDLLLNRLGVDNMTLAKIALKERLAVGEMPVLNPNMQKHLNIKLSGHSRKKDFNLIPHFPIIDQIFEEASGELEKQAWEPSAIDVGLYSKSEKNRMHLMRLQDSLMSSLWEPYKEKLTKEYLVQNQIEDLAMLSHEEQQQVKSDIANRAQQMTPEKINEYFDKEYYSQFSEMAQMLLDLQSKVDNLKDHFDRRFRHGYLNEAEISYMYESYGLPRIKLCERKKFGIEWEDGIDCIEDADACVYRDSSSLIQLFKEYGHLLKDADIEKLEKYGMYTTGLNGDFNISGAIKDVELMTFYSENQKESYPNGINVRTEEGQKTMLRLRSMFHNGRANRLIENNHSVIKTPILMKQVTRVIKGRIEHSWRHNDYMKNPDFGDIEVNVVRALQVRECRSLGVGSNKVYLNAGPIKYDWSDIADPRKKKLPYSGGFYGRDFSNSGVAPFDKGINYQVKINIEAGLLEEEKGFNLGKMFVMLQSARPDHYTPEMFLDTMRATRIIDLDETKLSPQLAGPLLSGGRIFNSVDMSNIVAIKDSIEQIQIHIQDMRRAMGVEGREVSPYASNENTRQAQANASSKTYHIYNKHSKFTNNTLQMYMDFCMYVYSKNPEAINWVANDMNMSILISQDFFALGRVGVFVGNNIREQAELQEFKLETLPFIQTGAYEVVVDFARIKQARSWGEVLNAAEGLAAKSTKMRAQMQQAQQATIDDEHAKEMEAKDKQWDHEKTMQSDKLVNSLDLATINSTQMLQAQDVDKNNQNDINERDEKRLRYEKERDEKDRRLKESMDREKLRLEGESIKADLKKIDALKKRERLTTKSKK